MIHLLLGLAVAASSPYSSAATMTSLGSSNARICFEAASARSATSRSMLFCNAAIDDEREALDRAATHVNRGILHLVGGHHREAEADFDRAISLEPGSAEAHLNKGLSRLHQGDNGEAIRLLNRALELRTRRPELAYYARGIARESSGDVRGAYGDLTRARALAPKWSEPQRELARYQVRSR